MTAPLAAQAQTRAVSKSQLPPGLRASLERGAAVHVTARGTDTVAASAANVTLRPGEVIAARTGAGGATVARLRSAGRGPARIRASAPGFQSAETKIDFGWPIVFLVAALSGGLLGGLATTTTRRQPGRKRRPLGTVLLHGVLIGLVAAVVYFGIGLNLLQFDVKVAHFNEIAVFAFAALAAMFGIPALSGASGSTDKS